MKTKYLRIGNPTRPVKWIIQDGLLGVFRNLIQLIESIIYLLTLSCVDITVSDWVLTYSLKRQSNRRKSKGSNG